MATNNVSASGEEITELPDATTTSVKFKALYIGGDGNVVISQDGGATTKTFVGCVAGSTLPVKGDTVMNTSTAINLVALNWI